MRKMMMVASLVSAAACGSVNEPGMTDEGPVSDTGSGSGSGAPEQPATCSVAADCGDGRACDVATHECVAGALTIDPTDFIVDGSGVWWTPVTAPTLRGTFDGPTDATVEARIGTERIPATLQGSNWSVTLPSGAISTSNTKVQISMTDPSGGLVELEQALGIDDAPPSISLAPSIMHDEAGDSIDFSTGQPVHTHVGASVDLASAGCPVVHKYAYLMGATDPTFGRQTSKNPFAWKFTIQDLRLDQDALAYRVIDPANAVAVDWSPLPTPIGGVYTIELDSGKVASLTSVPGNYHFEVRARDWGARESVASWCWNNQPLAAPLQFGAAGPVATGLFSMSLPANSPISRIIGNGGGAEVAEQTITQYTAEPVRISLRASATNVRYAKRVFHGWLPAGSMITIYQDEADLPPTSTLTATTGVLGSYSFVPALYDGAGTVVMADADGFYTLPARGANEAPRTFRLAVALDQTTDLQPASASIGEYAVGAVSYTGTAPSGLAHSICRSTIGLCRSYPCSCSAEQFREIFALDTAHLDFDGGIQVSVQTSPNANVTMTTPPYVPAAAFATSALSWDAGTEGLGAY